LYVTSLKLKRTTNEKYTKLTCKYLIAFSDIPLLCIFIGLLLFYRRSERERQTDRLDEKPDELMEEEVEVNENEVSPVWGKRVRRRPVNMSDDFLW
jgi:hypothetical protein